MSGSRSNSYWNSEGLTIATVVCAILLCWLDLLLNCWPSWPSWRVGLLACYRLGGGVTHLLIFGPPLLLGRGLRSWLSGPKDQTMAKLLHTSLIHTMYCMYNAYDSDQTIDHAVIGNAI